jgi:hypothetical protein
MMSQRDALVTLFRPVGQKELDLIRESGWLRFPPRLPGQSIFYPVLSERYAVQIARDWNTNDPNSGFVGYVLRFQICRDYINRHEPHTVGSHEHAEYWIPAEELSRFNDAIVGSIDVIHEFRLQQGSKESHDV